jgi:DNA-binding NarL/FixJ family response regulator
MPCQDCPKRHLCSELCPEAELIVSQDEVSLRELPIGLPRHGSFPDLISNIPLTEREKQIVTLLGQGMDRDVICKLLNITRGNLRIVICRLRKKCNGFYP